MHPRHALMPILLASCLCACGGGGGGGAPADEAPDLPDVATLEGSWFGHWSERTAGDRETYRMTFDGAGGITEIATDGVVTGKVGTVTPVASRQLSVVLSSGERGLLLIHDTGRHAGLLLDDWTRVALEKGAVALAPSYPETDVYGQSFAGTAASLSPEYAVTAVAASGIAFAADGSFGGYVGSTTFATDTTGFAPTLWDDDFGYWQGPYVSPTADDGLFFLRLSPDKTFALGGSASWDAAGQPCCDGRLIFLWGRQ